MGLSVIILIVTDLKVTCLQLSHWALKSSKNYCIWYQFLLPSLCLYPRTWKNEISALHTRNSTGKFFEIVTNREMYVRKRKLVLS